MKKYLEEGIDRLKLGAHFENWNNSRVTYPIMLVKYESIWENLPEIFDYLEIPKSEIGNFPPPQNRNSDWNLLSEDLKDLFFNMYGDLQEKIMNFDDIKIIKPKLSTYIFLPKYALYIGALYKQKLIG